MTQQRQKHYPPKAVVVPKGYAGRWIAWNRYRTRIVGSGENLTAARAAARAAGEEDPGYEWVPPANRRIIGSSL